MAFACLFHALRPAVFVVAEPPSLGVQPPRETFAELDRNVDVPCLATGTPLISVFTAGVGGWSCGQGRLGFGNDENLSDYMIRH